MATTSSVRLSKKNTNAELQSAVVPKSKVNIASPEQQLYGVFGPQLAAVMTASANGSLGETQRMADRIALKNRAAAEAERYSADLAESNAAALQAQKYGVFGELAGKQIDQLPAYTDRGMGGAVDLATNEEGLPVVNFDPLLVTNANQNSLNNDQAARLEKQANAVKTFSDAGYGLGLKGVSELITPPGQEQPMKVEPYMNPADATTRYGTDQGLTFEQQKELESLRASAKEKGDDIELSVVTGANGVAQVIAKGTPDALIRNGYDPITGERINPNAGANSGTAPATPTAAPKGAKVISANPSSFFRNARMTSASGMRLNPVTHRYANHDYAFKRGTPIPAEGDGIVVFSGQINGYGNTVKVRYNDGSVIQYSHNERNNVKVGDHVASGTPIGRVGSTGRSTGPHVHRRVEKQGSVQTVFANRLKAHPDVADVKTASDGRIVVTLKNGEQRVYKDGVRVG